MRHARRLETERLLLRPPEAGDLSSWTSFFLSGRAAFVGGGPQRDAASAWRVFAVFSGHWTLRGFGPFVMTLKTDGKPIGAVGPWFPSGWPEAELTWSIWRPDHEGQSFVSEAARVVRRFVFEEQQWTTAVSYIDPSNERSKAIALRLGGSLDPNAATPDGDPLLVYRYHPSTE